MVILVFVTSIKLIFKNTTENIFLQMDYTFKSKGEKNILKQNGVKIVKDV